MSKLSAQEKVNLIIEQAEKHGITAYEFGNNTEISTFAAEQLLKGKTKKPSSKTLNTMLEHIERVITGTEVDVVKEEKTTYKPSKTEGQTVETLIAIEVKKALRSEFAQISDAIVNNFADLEEIKEDLEDLKEKLNKIQQALKVKKSK